MNRSLLFLALLLAGPAQAYVILESKYHVEVSPGVFDDQLVLKCDNGRKLTVSWDARLSEVCGEVNIPRSAALQSERDSQQRQKDIQKDTATSRTSKQHGVVEEQHVRIDAEADGAAARFSPQMREILKRYELCRKHTKGSPSCAAERNQAMAALAAQPPGIDPAADAIPAGDPQAATDAQPTAARHQQPAKPVAKSNGVARPEAGAVDATIESAPAGRQEIVAPAPDRAARAQKIAQDYTWCMRAKPKFECDTQRAAALKALGAPARSKDRAAAAGKSADLATN